MIIVWRVTQQCNLSCPFCAWDRTQVRPRISIGAERVWRLCETLVDYQQKSRDQVHISWLGGEPLLWGPLHELAPNIAELGILQSATTNGTTLASSRVRKMILDCFSELTVSIDGFAPFHEHIRGWPGGWVRIQSAIRKLADAKGKSKRLKLRANIVVMRDNVNEFDVLCETLGAWGFDEITFNALGGRDRPEFFQGHSLSEENVRVLAAKLPAIKARLATQGVQLCGGPEYLNRIFASARKERLPVDDCAPGQTFYFIDEIGRISPCSFTTDAYSVSIDEIKSANDFSCLPAHFTTQRLVTPSAICQDCPSTQVFAKFAI